jgi:excisionase family DNA binding protein
MAANRPEITGRATNTNPLAITVQQACELSGLGATTIWAFLKDGRLEAVRVPGVRRTLVSYSSLARLLAPQSAPQRRRGPGSDRVAP